MKIHQQGNKFFNNKDFKDGLNVPEHQDIRYGGFYRFVN